MNPELEMKLVSKYPKIFRDYKGDPKYTCMAWGMSCGDGWYNLLDQACSDVTKVCNKYNITFVADQVKEKFGGLRFYYHYEGIPTKTFIQTFEKWFSKIMFKRKLGVLYWKINNLRQIFYKTYDEKIMDIISNAESDSYHICEKCGQPGKSRNGGWIMTLCDNCDSIRS